MAAKPICGGVSDVPLPEQNSLKFDDLARFAVDDHNKKENTLLQFKKVVNAKQQVVSGMLYILTLEVEDGGNNKIYEAKIWEQAWLNSKKVEEFKLIGDAPAHPSA